MAGDPSDATLLTAWRAGDSRAGSKLFDRHYTRLSRFFRNKVGDEIYDLVQQTMLTCLERADSLRDQDRFAAFVLGIARNVLLHHYRSRSREHDKIDFGISAVADFYVAGTSIVARHDRDRLLLEGLRQLPVEQQILIELYYWEELTIPALAELHAAPEGTIRTQLRAARIALTRKLNVDGDPDASELDAWARALRDLVDGT